MIEIIPAVIPKSYDELGELLTPLIKYVSLIQLDVVDGVFVKAKSWPYMGDHGEFENIQTEHMGLPFWDDVDYEIDLMVANPEHVIDKWITAGAKSIVIHVESTKNLEKIIKDLRERFPMTEDEPDIEIGLALNIDTPTDTVLPYLEDINFVQFMGIAEIGSQGQPFDERVLDKIHEFHNAHSEIMISVDGGVTLETVKKLYKMGARRFVSGSAILKSDSIKRTIEDFKHAV